MEAIALQGSFTTPKHPQRNISSPHVPELSDIITERIGELVRRNLAGHFSNIQENDMNDVLGKAIVDRHIELEVAYREKDMERIDHICKQIVRLTLASLRPAKLKQKRSVI